MGFFEAGQSLIGIALFVVVMLVAFGGFQNDSLYSSQLDDSFANPGDFNISRLDTNQTFSGTPFATETSDNPNQDNNPYLNLANANLPDFIFIAGNVFASMAESLDFIGLPGPIVYVIVVPIIIIMGYFTLFFLINIAAGALGRGGGV